MTRISKDISDLLDGTNKDENDECYKIGETKTINFIKTDGSQQMFPYSQLTTAWTEDTDEGNVIKMIFSTHVVTIKGHNLAKIYEAMEKHNLKAITAQDERYLKTIGEKNVFIKEIEIEWKKSQDNSTL